MRLHSTTLSGSLIVSQSGARIDAGGFSGSFSGSFSGDGSGLTSIDGTFGSTTRATLSASFMDVAGAAVSASFMSKDGAAVSASFVTNAQSGSFSTKAAHTASLFSGNENVNFSQITGSTALISGRLTVGEVFTQYVSSSVLVESIGSTKLGNESTDLHQVTGSMSILSGSLTLRGTAAAQEKVSGSAYSTGSFGRVEATTLGLSGDITYDDLTATGNLVSTGDNKLISGSATSTGSFGHVIVGGHLVSTASGSYDLGSVEKPWRDLHIITSSIKLYSGDGEIGRLQLGTNNELEFFDVSSLTPVQRKTFTPAQIRSNATRKNFRGAQGGNPNAKIRIGITGNQEIDTSAGNLILDSAGGEVAIDDNLKVSGSISVLSGSLTFRGTAAEVDKVSGSAYSTASFGRVENAVLDPSGLPSGTVSSSAQIATDVSGSLGDNAALIRTLTAAIISGSIGDNAALIRSLTAATVSGSLGANATLIRGLTAAIISGSSGNKATPGFSIAMSVAL